MNQLDAAKTTTKTCTKCGKAKQLSYYSRDKRSTDGCRCACKQCALVEQRRYRQTAAGKARDAKWNGTERAKEAKRLNMRHRAATAAGKAAHKASHQKLRESGRRQQWERSQTEVLADGYVKRKLARQLEIPATSATPELVELKRMQLETRRLARQIRKAANESITNTD